MKLDQTNEKIVINKVIEEQKELTFLGSTRLKKGHTLFEIDVAKETIVPAEYSDKEYSISLKSNNKRRVNIKKGCLYIGALNKKNAMKKLIKRLNK